MVLSPSFTPDGVADNAVALNRFHVVALEAAQLFALVRAVWTTTTQAAAGFAHRSGVNVGPFAQVLDSDAGHGMSPLGTWVSG